MNYNDSIFFSKDLAKKLNEIEKARENYINLLLEIELLKTEILFFQHKVEIVKLIFSNN